MRIDVMTLFPDWFTPLRHSGVVSRAFSLGQVDLQLWNPRDFAVGQYRRVDDRPYGGGPGMVMLAQPLFDCLMAIRSARAAAREAVPLIYFSPVGKVLSQAALIAQSVQFKQGVILLCGRYEGVDQRFIDSHVDLQLSLGDFVVSGGEIPALAWIDATVRMLPGVLHDPQSHLQDSFMPAVQGLLDCPHYTRPEVWQGRAVPEVLRQGNHQQIDRWREQQRQALTQQHRPDLQRHTFDNE